MADHYDLAQTTDPLISPEAGGIAAMVSLPEPPGLDGAPVFPDSDGTDYGPNVATVFPDYNGTDYETSAGPGVGEGLPASRETSETPDVPIPCGNDNTIPPRELSAVGSTGTGSVAAMVALPSSPVEVETTGVATDVHGEQSYYPGTHPLEGLGQDAR